MRTAFRYIYLGLAWLLLIAIVVQVLFAGFMLFGIDGGRTLHTDVGWVIHSAAWLLLFVPWLAKAGRTGILFGLGLFAAIFVQPLLPGLRDSVPFIAALHPVNALLIFWLSLVVAKQSLAVFRQERAATPATHPV